MICTRVFAPLCMTKCARLSLGRAWNSDASRDPAINLDTREQRYQTLVRSCSTLTRYAILVATGRIVERGHTDGVVLDKLPEPILHEPEPWMSNMTTVSLKGLFLNAPVAVRFLLSHPETLPNRLPDELLAAGLVERRDGKARVRRYSQSDLCPYGPEGINPVTLA